MNGNAQMTGVEKCVRMIRGRQQRQILWRYASSGLLAGSLAGCVVAVARLFVESGFSWSWVIAAILAGPTIGLAIAAFRLPSMRDAAAAIDSSCGLKDRTQTALSFLNRADDQPLRSLQIADAEQHLSSVDPIAVAPIRNPQTFPLAVMASIAAVMLVMFTSPRQNLVAAPVANMAVISTADRAEAGLEELKEFQQDQPDPELEELLKELAAKIELLKEPGMDPKEALAQLSEMEAALEEMQQNLNDPSMEAEMEKIGEALSLSEAMAVAGAAMSKGEMEKAAEELQKLEMPELDQKTEKAITEKLAEIKENAGENGQSRKELKEAAGQIAAGLSKGDRSKFKDGMEGLAGQCKKQGQRKKLSDLLRKQCQCLSECKSECESECKSQADSKKKGGTKAGKGASGNDPGDKTPQLKTNPQMNITGQDSGQGDVDVETEEGTAQEQEAVRQYREKLDQYEAMTESVLNSESIPLGHRQTIRRYFESIRPQGAEMDMTNEKMEQ